MYLQRIKEYRAKNRRKALRFFLAGLLGLTAGFFTLGIFFYFFGESGNSLLKFLLHRIVEFLFLGGIGLIVYALLALFKGIDPDIYA